MNRTFPKRILSMAAVMLIAILCLAAAGCEKPDPLRENFNAGVELYDKGRLDEAKEKFLLAEGFGTAADYIHNIEECQRLVGEAQALIDKREYQNAYALLATIPLYDKAEEKKAYIDGLSAHFAEGASLFESNKYLEAKAEFELAVGYENSAEYLSEIERMNTLYEEAKALLRLKDHNGALLKLRSIAAPFEDSAELIEECMLALGRAPIKPEVFVEFYNDEYPDGSVSLRLGEVGSQFAVSDTLGILFSGVLDEDGGIISMSIFINPALAAQLGAEGCNNAVARCIHAMNPHVLSIGELEANLDTYLSGGELYGQLRIGYKVDNGGAIAVNIAFVYPES